MRYLYSVLIAVAVFAFLALLASHPPGTIGGTLPVQADKVPLSEVPAMPRLEPAAAASDPAPLVGELNAASPAAPPIRQRAEGQPSGTGDSPARESGSLPVGDPAAGRQVFRKCQACHSLNPGKNLVGPSLAGIIGRKAGADPTFSYSPAMKQSGITWNVQTIETYLGDPQKLVPGNRMPFPGLKSEHDRSDVVAFLSNSSREIGNAAKAGPMPQQAQKPPAAPGVSRTMSDMSDVRYTLRSGIAEGRMVYLGVGGAIDGKVNPVLTAAEGQIVQVTIINGEGAEHDIAFPDQNARSPRVTGKGASTTIAFRADKAGDFTYFCTAPGHRRAGMEGKFVVTPKPAAQTVAYADLSRDPTDLPPALPKRGAQTVRVDLVTEEIEGRLAEGTNFGFWTFNGKVPGPFLRVRVGDTLDVHVKNSAESSMIHSVDFHAATGPGGGAAALQVEPGSEKSMKLKMLMPGLYVYHCATPMVAEHIANGMYGMILVEPEAGLPKVDREFYIMQGEIYTDAPFGQHGSQEFSVEKLLAEHPEYFVFNGSVGALTTLHPMHATVGQTVRVFFGVGGPNFTSSFHVIGTIFDKVYDQGGILSEPLRGIQTTTVAPGGATIAEFTLKVPGRYAFVDHALARMERGLVGVLVAEGPQQPEIFDGQISPGAGGH